MLKNILKKFQLISLFVFLIFCLSMPVSTVAQCAMCKATVENNIKSNDKKTYGKGLNKGILYLLVMPYIIIGTIGFLWYRNSKKQQRINGGM